MFNKLPICVGGAAADEPNHPFKIFVKKIGEGAEAKQKRGVYFDSKLFKSLSYTDTRQITGLLTSLTPTDKDDGWAETEDGDYVWLEVKFLLGSWPTIENVSIRSKKIDHSLNPFYGGGEIEHDNATAGQANVYAQIKAKLILGLISIVNETATIDQRVKNNLRLEITGGTAYNSKFENPHFVATSYPYVI